MFERDRYLVNRLFEEQFGVPLIPAGCLALLNKVPDEDGNSVLMPGVISVSPDIVVGDSVFVLSEEGTSVAVGRAKMSYAETIGASRGQLVRHPQNAEKSVIDPLPSTWDDIIQANEGILDLYESKSIEFIREMSSPKILSLLQQCPTREERTVWLRY